MISTKIRVVVLPGLANVPAPESGIGDAQGAAGLGVPERGARAREERGRETALARVPAQGHSRVGAPRGAPEEVEGALHQDGRFHGGARGRGRGRDLDGRRGVTDIASSADSALYSPRTRAISMRACSVLNGTCFSLSDCALTTL